MIAKFKSYFNKFRLMSVPAKASIAFLICSFMQRGISTITTPIFTRLLTSQQYGYYSIFNSWIDIVSVFTTLKLAGGVFSQALVKFDKNRAEITASTAGLGTALSLIAIIIYIPFRGFINNIMGVSTLIMLCILITSWASLIFELWAAKQRVEYTYKALVALTIFTSIAKPVLGILAILMTDTYKAEARIISLVAVEVFTYLWIFISFFKRGTPLYNKNFWTYSLSLNIPLIPHYLTRTVLNQCDRLMINKMIGYSEAGIYSLAYNLAWMLVLVTNAILSAFNPWMYDKIKRKKYKEIGKLSYGLLIIVAICGLALISIAPEIIRIFAPPDYFSAIWVIPPVTTSVYFLFMYSLFANFEFYFEETNFMSIASTFGGVLNVVLNYFFIKSNGYLAAGYTTLLCYFFFAVAHYYCMKKLLKKNANNVKVYNMKVIGCITFIFMLFSAILMILYNHSIIRYLFIVLGLILIYYKKNVIMKIIKLVKSNKI